MYVYGWLIGRQRWYKVTQGLPKGFVYFLYFFFLSFFLAISRRYGPKSNPMTERDDGVRKR